MYKEIIEFFKDNLLLFNIFGILLMFFVWQCYAHAKTNTYSKKDILSYYGYKKIEQVQALEYVLEQAGQNNFFPKRKNKQEIAIDILNFVKATQNHFILRVGFQERWETSSAQWMQQVQIDEAKKQKVLEGFKP